MYPSRLRYSCGPKNRMYICAIYHSIPEIVQEIYLQRLIFQSSDVDIMAAKWSRGNKVALSSNFLDVSPEPFVCGGRACGSIVARLIALKVPRGPEGFSSGEFQFE